MFGKFLFWLRRRSDQRRGLFPYFDGRCYRRVDALDACRKFFSHPKVEWDEADGRIHNGPSGLQLEAIGGIAEAVREIFRIPPVEKGGLTEIGCIDVFMDFRYYLNNVKKNGNLFPTSLTSQESDLPSLVMPPPLPSASSVSGSTPAAPSDAPDGLPVDVTSKPSISGAPTA